MDAAYTNANNNARAANQRISTHPSYTEYSWDSLTKSSSANVSVPVMQTPVPRPSQNGRSTQAMHTAVTPRGTVKQRPQGRNGFANTAAADTARGGLKQPRAGISVFPARKSKSTPQPHARHHAKQSAAAAKTVSRAKHAEEAIKQQAKNAEKLRRKSIVAIHTIVVEKKYAFPMAVVLIALCFTIIIMAIITTSVQISEITSENSDLQRTYNSMVSEHNELRLRLETRDDLRVVESMAKEDLGMVKKDEVERYYLTVRKEDRIEILEAAEEEHIDILGSVMNFGSSIVDRIRAFFGM